MHQFTSTFHEQHLSSAVNWNYRLHLYAIIHIQTNSGWHFKHNVSFSMHQISYIYEIKMILSASKLYYVSFTELMYFQNTAFNIFIHHTNHNQHVYEHSSTSQISETITHMHADINMALIPLERNTEHICSVSVTPVILKFVTVVSTVYRNFNQIIWCYLVN